MRGICGIAKWKVCIIREHVYLRRCRRFDLENGRRILFLWPKGMRTRNHVPVRSQINC